jgi:hypothetical protein
MKCRKCGREITSGLYCLDCYRDCRWWLENHVLKVQNYETMSVFNRDHTVWWRKGGAWA